MWDDTKGPSFQHWLAGEPPSGLTESRTVLLLTGDRSLSKAEGVATRLPQPPVSITWAVVGMVDGEGKGPSGASVGWQKCPWRCTSSRLPAPPVRPEIQAGLGMGVGRGRNAQSCLLARGCCMTMGWSQVPLGVAMGCCKGSVNMEPSAELAGLFVVSPHHAVASRFEPVSLRPCRDGEALAMGIYFLIQQPGVSAGV